MSNHIILDCNILVYMKDKLNSLKFLLSEFNTFMYQPCISELKKFKIKKPEWIKTLDTIYYNCDIAILNSKGYSVLTNDKNLKRSLKNKGIRVYTLSKSKYILKG
jgi:rRNA-processing protein FCF1